MNKTGKTDKHHRSGFETVVFVWLIVLGVVLASCGGMKTAYRYSRAKMGADIDIKVDVSEKVNENSPVAVDIVVVGDEKLLELLKGLEARDWFQKRDQIKRDNNGGDSLFVWSWEWVPGQTIPLIELPWKHHAVGAIIFANYHAPGAHRVSIDPFTNVNLRLQEKGFSTENIDE